MTREEFIKRDEYLIATVECIVVSRKSIIKTREELNKFLLDWRDELLLYAQQPNSEPQPQLQQANVSGSCGKSKKDDEADICPRCGNNYWDITGAGVCYQCSWKPHDR